MSIHLVRKRFRLILLMAAIVMVLAMNFIASPGNSNGNLMKAQAQTWALQWSDEFNGAANTGVDPNNWKYDTGTGIFGTGEIETMTNSTANVYQDGAGHLVLKALGSGNSWTSGRIETQRSDFQPPAGGIMRVESSIQQPNLSGAAAAGYWPAFWMLGSTLRTGGVWPDVGEWDVLEDINGRSSVFGTLHCGVNPGGPCNESTGIGSGERACSGCQTGFHTYAIEYDTSVSPEQLRWYLDGVNYFTINANQLDATTWNHATHRGNFLIYDLAMGGGFPAAFGGGPTASTQSGGMLIADYVRVYYSGGAVSTPIPPTTPPTAGCGTTNLALNKTATSSSNEAAGTTPNLAVDGNTGTRWSSAFSDPQWLQVDLGSTQNLCKVTLIWEAAYGKAYQIQTSNDAANWTTIYSTTTGAGGTENLNVSGSGRYLRMYGTARGTPYGYSLWEIQAYGLTATNTPTPPPSGDGTPFTGTPYPIPGKVEAENYNNGGEGVAYHDTDATNNGGQYRANDGVDIEATTDTGGGFNVGWTAAAEYMKYTVNVASSGTYSFDFRVASAATGGTFHLEVDNTNVTGSLTVPNTGGWQTWTDVVKTGVTLSAGQHVFKWVSDAAGGNYNWFSVSSAGGGATNTATFVPPTVPPTVPPSCGTTNMALNKTATSSSNENAGTTPNLAVDGNTGTRWSSAFSDPQWLQVDLGATNAICHVKLTWEAAYGKSYQIQVSNDAVNWTTIYSTTTGAGGVNDLTGLSGSGRYVRMYGTVRGTVYGYSLWEFEVYTSGGSGGPTPTVTPVSNSTFWGNTAAIPPATNVLTFAFLNRTNGVYPDNQVYWSFNGQTHTIADMPYFDMPANSSGRMYFYLGSPTSQYNDFIEFTIGPGQFNGNTTRVDAFGLKIAMRLHASDGYDVAVGEDLTTFQEDRAVTFQKFINEVPVEFQHLAQIQAPFRIPAPAHSGDTAFLPGGAYANYFDSYIASVGANATTADVFGCTNALGSNASLCAGLNRHVGQLSASQQSTPSLFYQASPANYYAQFWHNHSLGGVAYGFPYDDVAGQSSYISHANPQWLAIAIGW